MTPKKKTPARGAERAPAPATEQKDSTAPLQFGPTNVVLGIAGLAALVGGYILLSQGSITAAPLLLVFGYVVLIPAAILN